MDADTLVHSSDVTGSNPEQSGPPPLSRAETELYLTDAAPN